VWGVGCGVGWGGVVWDVGFGAWGLESGAWGLGFRDFTRSASNDYIEVVSGRMFLEGNSEWIPPSPHRRRASMALTQQPRPYSGLGFQSKVLLNIFS